MTRFVALVLALIVALAGCATRGSDSGWTTLIDGDKGLENFNRIGDANWRTEGGAVVADKGKGGQLVTKNAYKDFEIYAEFWADHHTNSGIFIRASDPKQVGAANAYEVNIYDQRPGPEYARELSSTSPWFPRAYIRPAASGTLSRSMPRDRR